MARTLPGSDRDRMMVMPPNHSLFCARFIIFSRAIHESGAGRKWLGDKIDNDTFCRRASRGCDRDGANARAIRAKGLDDCASQSRGGDRADDGGRKVSARATRTRSDPVGDLGNAGWAD
jgi:hypothetical protein